MNDDVERLLRQATPRGAPPELRGRVLAAVADELDSVARPGRSLRLPLAVAAAVLVSLASNVLVSDAVDRRLAIALGPIPVQKQAAEIADDVASLTDPPTGRWAYERLTASPRRDDEAQQYAARLQRMIQHFTFDPQGAADETPRENPQMDRDRRGSRDRRPFDAQYVLRLEHRNTA
ncbi:MAG: hypothetical protein P4L85_24230 [Paludisphaera borealis]|uniref:hypothetical protein n=1 Tax=Paludisphaera borealis TaxID=1387353 RepID=UPI0028483606|nr:hypothetical protein [Paludisphaera borealis]MDR3622481.1 hypothetical protein [Paludisphaera borealis]